MSLTAVLTDDLHDKDRSFNVMTGNLKRALIIGIHVKSEVLTMRTLYSRSVQFLNTTVIIILRQLLIDRIT